VCVADDDIVLAETMGRSLRRAGFRVEVVNTGKSVIEQLDQSYFDALVLDLNMPDTDGWGVMAHVAGLSEPPVIIVVSGAPRETTAAMAIRRGAVDFLEKPFHLEDLTERLDLALGTAALRKRLVAAEIRLPHDNMVAESAAMQKVLKLADRVAAPPASSALIVGETGTGKEMVATRIHSRSQRADGPFVRVNLAAIPDTMIEAELFGSVRGAFTDSQRDRNGLLASADHGTILLDELCEFRPDLQPKLLRVLEERRFFPVGSDRERRVDVRVLAATNRDPAQAMAAGLLREDLFYRIGTVVIEVPPLRARREDVVRLAEQCAARFCQEFGRPQMSLDKSAQDALLGHSWPGNVRELRNVVERAVMMAEGDVLDADGLGLTGPRSDVLILSDLPLKLDDARAIAVERVERSHIERVLGSVEGNQTKAAEILGISRSTLWEKMKKYEIS
jgi:DNA-binding NtrC family response regulator